MNLMIDNSIPTPIMEESTPYHAEPTQRQNLYGFIINIIGFLFLADFFTHLGEVFLILGNWLRRGYQGNLNVYNLFFINLSSELDMVRPLITNAVSLVMSILLFYLARKVKLNLPKTKLVLILFCVYVSYILINSSIILEISKRKLVNEDNFQKRLKTVDRATETDLSIIWALKDPTLCKNQRSFNMLKSCMSSFDKSAFTMDYCSVLPEIQERNYCLLDIARSKGDRNICEEISTDSAFLKESCLDDVSQKINNE